MVRYVNAIQDANRYLGSRYKYQLRQLRTDRNNCDHYVRQPQKHDDDDLSEVV